MATIKELKAEVKRLEREILCIMVKMDELDTGSNEYATARDTYLALCDQQRAIKRQLPQKKPQVTSANYYSACVSSETPSYGNPLRGYNK